MEEINTKKSQDITLAMKDILAVLDGELESIEQELADSQEGKKAEVNNV